VLAAGAAGAALAIAGIGSPLRAPLVLVFLLAVPALAVDAWLPGFGTLARAVVAGTAAIVVDTLAAGVMVVSGGWSPRAGVVAVALVSLLIAAAATAYRRSRAVRTASDDGEIPVA